MKIFFDENFSQYLVSALKELQKGSPCDGVEVLSMVDMFGRGAMDEVWIPEVAKLGGIAITQDLNIYRVRAQMELCQQYGTSVIFLKPPKKGGWNFWIIVDVVMRNWGSIKEITEKSKKPFYYQIEVSKNKWKKF